MELQLFVNRAVQQVQQQWLFKVLDNPETLNAWLKQNNGFTNNNIFIWGSVAKLGLVFQRKVNKNDVKKQIDNNKIVISKVMGGKHWVLVTGSTTDKILVNDAGYNKSEYPLSDIVQAAVFKVKEQL